jgi:hypothetical protein
MLKKKQVFLKQNLEFFFLEPFTLKTHKKQKVTSWCTSIKYNIVKYKSK